ncbi:MAG: peptidylprolyl isomerase [Planctomycetota bacterium]
MNSTIVDPATSDRDRRHEQIAKWIRIGIIAAIALLILWLVLAIVNDGKEAAVKESWDQLSQLRTDLEPERDDFWFGLRGTADATRQRYIGALQKFIEHKQGEVGPALEGQARWHLARALTNHLLGSPQLIDRAKRDEYYKRALAELQYINASLPEYPLNDPRWNIAEPTKLTLTRQFMQFLERNRAWESEHLPQAKQPDGDTTIVFRTMRGDVRIKLYASDAPTASEALTARVVAGGYDGVSFFQREGNATEKELSATWVRLGHSDVLDPKPYDRDGQLPLGEEVTRRGRVYDESRNRILHERGVVSAWHDGATEYDDPEDLVFLTRRSPDMDYEYTPVGRVIDDASLAVLDAIFGSATWSEDAETRNAEGAKYANLLEVFQVPVVVVKALAYDASGKLLTPAVGKALPSLVAPTTAEGSLATLDADAYKVDVPKRPLVEVPPDEGGDDGDADADGGDKPAEGADGDGDADEGPKDDGQPEDAGN